MFHAHHVQKRLLLIIALLLGAQLSHASQAGAFEPSEQEKRLIELIENRMNGLTTLEADFVQLSSQEDPKRGRIYIKRPGKFRIVYDTGNILLSNGKVLLYVDQELEEVQQILISGTPAELLVKPKLKFSGDIQVLGIDINDERIGIRLTQTEEEGRGTATLYFNAKDYLLQGWEVDDALDQNVKFNLTAYSLGSDLKDRLFVFFAPPGWSD